MKYLPTTGPSDAAKQAEAIGRAYATKIGKPWPMPPDSYGPGRQPVPPEAYYQRFYVAPQPDPSQPDPKPGGTDTRALVLLVDAVVTGMDKAQVTISDGTKITIDVSKAVTLVPVKPVLVQPTAAIKG